MSLLKAISIKQILHAGQVSQNSKCYLKLVRHFGTVDMSFITYDEKKDSSMRMAPPLIVMHGLFGSKRNWNSLCKVFSQRADPHRQIIAVDARNHGDSPHSEKHSYLDMAADIRYLCDDLKIKKTALLGHSMGGRAVMCFALQYPQLVDKLVIVDMSPFTDSPNLNSMHSIFNILQQLQLPSNMSLSEARAICDKQLSERIYDEDLRAFLLTNLAKGSDGRFTWKVNVDALMKNFTDNIAKFPDLTGHRFDGPVLFVGGGESDFIKESDFPKILELFPKAELKMIEGAGHWLHSEKPKEFLQICIEFLNR